MIRKNFMVDYLESILIKRCQNREAEAFAPLMNMYKKQLFSYIIKRTENRETAEDLFQEILTKIWRNLPKYQRKEKFGSWIFSIAHNLTVDSFRKKKVRSIISQTEGFEKISLSEDPFEKVEKNEQIEILNEALSNLSEKQREVFLLRQHGEMTFKEIAVFTNQPINTVLSHMNYSIKKLKRILRKENAER